MPTAAEAWEDPREEAREEAAAANDMRNLEDTAADRGDAPPPEDISADANAAPKGAPLVDDRKMETSINAPGGMPLVDDQEATGGDKTPDSEAPDEDTSADKGSVN